MLPISRYFVIFTVALFSSTVNADKVFRLTDPPLMFSYPDNWFVYKRKKEGYIAVVRSDLNPGVDCVVTRKPMAELQVLTEGEMEAFRSETDAISDVIEQLRQDSLRILIKKRWRGSLGLREAEFVDIEAGFPEYGVEKLRAYVGGITFEWSARVMLGCAGPVRYLTELKHAFGIISESLRFESE